MNPQGTDIVGRPYLSKGDVFRSVSLLISVALPGYDGSLKAASKAEMVGVVIGLVGVTITSTDSTPAELPAEDAQARDAH